jgi:thymidylate synthase
MQYKEFAGNNSFLIGMSKILLKEAVLRETRGFKCFEIPNPVIVKISNPTARLITAPERNWNYVLPYVESLWLASGRNDLKLVEHYVKKLHDFSDDDETMRGGYGPRMRFYNGIADDYNTGYHQKHEQPTDKRMIEIDQFEFVEKTFQKDPYTRQGIISICDPAKDCFIEEHELKKTKDFPCTRNIQFIRNNDKLDVIVHMRSNDFVWGATGVNIFNFTFIQEYFAQILGLKVGCYYHIVNNFHYYENFKKDLEKWADLDSLSDEGYEYKKSFKNLNEFDEKVKLLEDYEKSIREDGKNEMVDLGDDFFNDWAKVLYFFHFQNEKIKFDNPVLQVLSRRKLSDKRIKTYRKQYDNTFNNTNNEQFWRKNM